MDFEWDETKNATNKAKHGVGFEIARAFLWDEAIIETDSRRDYGEERFIARGPASDGLRYHIAFTMRGDTVRLITMRRFSRRDYLRYGR
ncbi:hypothetical protein GCM10007913_34750 [Devosia yakushimensis]|uniref:BrnT family toxin n=1 Tax=Devosia yakushimensis TaxID=470028 RepID=A0ABQ5UHK2_9HYPH|nr:BrnT family toxin [Devosia yakushimensis]GLQ11543.1 hypothetical protein GCM10007913_34750 [Devosia yakushimensis]